VGPRTAAGGRGRGEARGCMGRPKEKRSGASPDEQEKISIYSIKFQTSLNCFDPKVVLPSSKNSK
jgi:hypothetical protein